MDRSKVGTAVVNQPWPPNEAQRSMLPGPGWQESVQSRKKKSSKSMLRPSSVSVPSDLSSDLSLCCPFQKRKKVIKIREISNFARNEEPFAPCLLKIRARYDPFLFLFFSFCFFSRFQLFFFCQMNK